MLRCYVDLIIIFATILPLAVSENDKTTIIEQIFTWVAHFVNQVTLQNKKIDIYFKYKELHIYQILWY